MTYPVCRQGLLQREITCDFLYAVLKDTSALRREARFIWNMVKSLPKKLYLFT